MWIGYFAQREEELVRQVIASTIPSSENSALVHTREMERAIASTMPLDPLNAMQCRVGKSFRPGSRQRDSIWLQLTNEVQPGQQNIRTYFFSDLFKFSENR